MCDKLGIPCVPAFGDVQSGSDASWLSHAYNYVQMEDGKWYAIDVTWNDPSASPAKGGVGKIPGYENANYFLIGGKTVYRGTKFLAGRITDNKVPSNIVSNVINFSNGPILSDTAYPRSVHLAYDGLPETLSAGDSVSMVPVPRVAVIQPGKYSRRISNTGSSQ